MKDASAGVLKDLKRFQLEKEDDLKKYMVSGNARVVKVEYLPVRRWHMPGVISTGLSGTSKHGEKPRMKSTRSMFGSFVRDGHTQWPSETRRAVMLQA